MKIKVKFFAILRERAGTAGEFQSWWTFGSARASGDRDDGSASENCNVVISMEVFRQLWALGVQDDSTLEEICKGQKSPSYPQALPLLLLDMFIYLSKAAFRKNSLRDQAKFCVSLTHPYVRLGSSEMTTAVKKRLRRLPKLKRCG